jgi:hypothetical protein
MSSGEDISKRRQFRIWDLLCLTTVIATGLATFAYAVKNSVSTLPQFVMLLAGWCILGGCVGASLGWLRSGTTTDAIEGFVLGMILTGPVTFLLIQFGP